MAETREWPEFEELPTEADVKKFGYLAPALSSLYDEMNKISSKKHAELVSKYQLRVINKTLGDVKDLLKGDPALEHLDQLEEEELPRYSDAVVLLGQFQAALNRFMARFLRRDPVTYDTRWFTQEDPPDIYVEYEEEDEEEEDEEEEV